MVESVANTINADVNMKLNPDNANTIDLVDNLDITDKFKEQVLIPYLQTLWESLTAKSSSTGKGIARFAFISV